MDKVWYAGDGATLYARTATGKVYETQDFETWKAAVEPPRPPATLSREPVRKPDLNAAYFALNPDSPQLWGVGQQLYRSEDGASWETLTAYKSGSVVGGGFHSVAISPNDPNQLAVANDSGVWRTMDGGLTWAGMNQGLPNLAVQRILATPSSGHAAQILTQPFGALQLLPGAQVWQRFRTIQPSTDALRKSVYSSQLNAEISSFAEATDGRTVTVYAGSSDGRIWRSDDGAPFGATQIEALPGHRVEKLWVDPLNPKVVLAAFSGEGAHVQRTFNGGGFWEPLDSPSLPTAAANAVTADPASGAIYVATDKGVYWTHFTFENGARADNLTWVNLSANLPPAKATDVVLDPAGVQLYVALDGYGVYGAPSPHRSLSLRLVDPADQTARAAAPGSLVSVVGQTVNSVSSGGTPYKLWNNSQFQVPFEALGPTVSLALQTASGSTLTRDLQVQAVSPVIFVPGGVPFILDADSGLPLEGNLAHPGQRLQLMMNGLGKVRPDWQAGVIAPSANTPEVVAKVQAFLDGNEVPVSRAILAPGYVGMYLVEVQLPVISNYGAMELHIAADGKESNHVQIAIAQ
jgi:uncharacterized protein (TIGR03437 family)